MAEIYYAKDLQIWKSPIREKIEGGERVTLGFLVCTASEVVGKEGAAAIAGLMNIGEEVQASQPTDAITGVIG